MSADVLFAVGFVLLMCIMLVIDVVWGKDGLLSILVLASSSCASFAADVYVSYADKARTVHVGRGDVLHVKLPGVGWKTATNDGDKLHPLPGLPGLGGARFQAREPGCVELRFVRQGRCWRCVQEFNIKVVVPK